MTRSQASRSAPRGGGLMALGTIVLGWVLLRAILWVPPFAPASTALSVPQLAEALQMTEESTGEQQASGNIEPGSGSFEFAPSAPHSIQPPSPDWRIAPPPPPVLLDRPETYLPPPRTTLEAARAPIASRSFAGAARLVAHALLLREGYKTQDTLRSPPSPARLAAAEAGLPAPTYAPIAAAAMREPNPRSRWAMDAWALWRDDSSTPVAAGTPSYGRSQMGTVMRYRLAPASDHAPQLYLRGSLALEGAKEREVALGASARPIPVIPVRLAAEARLNDTANGTEPRAAAYAVSEFPPLALPGQVTGEAYVQAGYVTGDFETAFVDGQARLTRELAGSDDFRLAAGAGAWGGAQENAGRLDIGPSAALNFRIGQAQGRVSADYRFRVAGNAQPASGPALTLSAGF